MNQISHEAISFWIHSHYWRNNKCQFQSRCRKFPIETDTKEYTKIYMLQMWYNYGFENIVVRHQVQSAWIPTVGIDIFEWFVLLRMEMFVCVWILKSNKNRNPFWLQFRYENFPNWPSNQRVLTSCHLSLSDLINTLI